jgi:hypothetical protein
VPERSAAPARGAAVTTAVTTCERCGATFPDGAALEAHRFLENHGSTTTMKRWEAQAAVPVDDGPVRVIYMAHPLGFGQEREGNRQRAARWVAWISATFKVAVIADWIILSGQWDETPDNRALGMTFDVALVERADELWMVGGRVSAGMKLEADAARRAGKRVIDLTLLGDEPPAKREKTE